MEFVGRKVTKDFKGFGALTGVVKSYDGDSGFFEIGYEDGDSEEIDFDELAALLELDGVLPDHSVKNLSRVAQRPKKRRRVFGVSNSGNENDFSSSALTIDDSSRLNSAVKPELMNEVIVGDDLSKSMDLSSNNNDNGGSNSDHLNSNLNEDGIDLNNGKGNEDGIDLNMDLNEENDLEPKGEDLVDDSLKKEQSFDLNMEIDNNENKNQDVDLGGYMKKEDSVEIAAESPLDLANQNSPDDQTKNVDSREDLEIAYKGKRRGRKKRKLTDTPKTPTESVLRRSARRQAKLTTEDTPKAINFNKVESSLPSPVISVVSEDQPTISGCEESEEREEPVVIPMNLELPPSFGNMNLDGLPVLDVLSVYAFLRSFSTLLFLSPFELADFVSSIRSKSPSLLIDSIHVSLLRVLRKQLEFESSENITSATNCLRDLNWDLLDVITWPIFMVEYLLTKPDFNLTHLKLHKTDYYKQSEFVKVEILHYLCDDVIEVESISAEITRRTLVGEYANSIDHDQYTKSAISKKRRAILSISGSSVTEEVIDETADWNSDECCLCKMDGNLICCDGCPSAFHSKCVGIANSLLPEGDWFCPECVIDKKNLGINVSKVIRGAELLGVDPNGRLYYSSCNYVVVSDPSDNEIPIHYYHMNDLTSLINALNLLNGPYKAISNTITKNANLYRKLHGSTLPCESSKPIPKHETAPEEKPPLPSSAELNSSKTESNSTKNTRKVISQKLEIGYLNLYSFARVASSVAAEWTKPSDKITQTPSKSLEELITLQMKAISKTSVDFCWSNMRNLSIDAKKEKCGWCLACKFPTDDGDCLFFMNNVAILESFTSDLLGFGLKIERNDRLIDVMCHIICIEDRLHGLLLGPWLNPHFSKVYRKSFLEASDIGPVKEQLLLLESNIRLRALSDEWLKHVDSVVTVGSASHIVTSKNRVNSRNVIGKNRFRSLDSEPHSSKNASSGLGLFWWRGGGITRQLFNWKVLPHSLACKAARQGGGKKIDGILYPENSEYPKRTRAFVWRAAVESAVTVEQLALQVRELDAHIKWEEIENSSHIAKMDKESLKSMRSFKKAIIRRKSSEQSSIKYLLDFGKRRFIPDTITKHGTKLEDSSDGRKKYWAEESYVPLFLLKPFEDRRIAFKSNKMSPNKVIGSKKVEKCSQRKLGFSYLFERAEKAVNHRCAHCNKDVPISDAVSCQYCEGFFHRRHVKKTSGGATTKCTYTCHKCHAGETVKATPKKGKSKSQKTKKSSKTIKSKATKKSINGKQSQDKGKTVIVPLRRSARTAKIVSIQSKKKKIKKKKKQSKSVAKKKKQLMEVDPIFDVKQTSRKRGRPRKNINDNFQKKRTQSLYFTYWLNGLLFSRKPDDERVKEFRTRNHLVQFEPLDLDLDSDSDRPKCRICEEVEFRSELNYINCETCGDWYHGDAFGLKDEHIGIVIGFKCHKCRERAPPMCPHLVSNESTFGQQKNDDVAREVLLKNDDVASEVLQKNEEVASEVLLKNDEVASEVLLKNDEVASEILLEPKSDTILGLKEDDAEIDVSEKESSLSEDEPCVETEPDLIKDHAAVENGIETLKNSCSKEEDVSEKESSLTENVKELNTTNIVGSLEEANGDY